MLDPQELVQHWGYLAIFVVVVLGNLGLPLPAGYLVWDGRLRLSWVVLIGVASAVAGDNLGYWVGREYGRRAVERYGHWVLITRDRLDAGLRLVHRYGALAVFFARFVPGLRFLAGPVAGITGLRPASFIFANVCGALLYVPATVGLGYALGFGLRSYIEAVERVAGRAEHLVLLCAAAATLVIVIYRVHKAWQKPQSGC
jgi:membrane protein DedA with SNARE-associated domain